MRSVKTAVGSAAAAVLLAACGGAQVDGEPSASSSPTAPAPSQTDAGAAGPRAATTGPVAPASASDVITGLQAPWSVALIDGGSALVSLRDSGEILLLTRSATGWRSAPAGRLAQVRHSNEGGLMGLAVAPAGGEVYAMLTADTDNRVVRMSWDGRTLGPPVPVIVGLPKAEIHNGGRIAFGPDGSLFVATGDAGQPDLAQDPGSLAGKILRVLPDGAVPPDNPFPGSPVYSLGHRNVQGLAFDDGGNLWASEFGAKDVDEINLITAGANYGWPLVEGPGGGQGLTDPVATFSPTSTASPSGLAYAQGSLWVASLRGRTLYQVPIAAGAAAAPVGHFAGEFGRLRDVVNGPGGTLWILTNNTDGRGDPGPQDDRLIEVALAAPTG